LLLKAIAFCQLNEIAASPKKDNCHNAKAGIFRERITVSSSGEQGSFLTVRQLMMMMMMKLRDQQNSFCLSVAYPATSSRYLFAYREFFIFSTINLIGSLKAFGALDF
jgi:hypothetical protein